MDIFSRVCLSFGLTINLKKTKRHQSAKLSTVDLVAKASTVFGKLEKRVWSDCSIATNTKLSVYEACVLTVLLHGFEKCTSYRHHINLLELPVICKILNIECRSYT